MSGAASALKIALTNNNLTLEQLLKLPRHQALRLPMFGPKVLAEAKRQADKRGGARAGAGRKAEDGATGLVLTSARVTLDQRDKLARLGGSVWLRRAIENAAEKEG